MKNKLKTLALLLALSLVLSLAACGSGAASVASVSEPSAASAAESVSTPEETPEVSEEPPQETEAPVETAEPEEPEVPAEEPSAVEEEPEEEVGESGLRPAKTGNDMVTDEDVEEIKAYIKASIIENYLEPNGITPEDFQWPTEGTSWGYLYDTLIADLRETSSTQKTLEKEFPDYLLPFDAEDQAIMDAAFKGLTNWLDTFEGFDSYYISTLRMVLDPIQDTISSIDVTEP